MYGYIYETINLVNGKRYIGKHKSSTFDESYKGSGILLHKAFDKYGWDKFETHILHICDNEDELNSLEEYYIHKLNAIESSEYYNLAKGGRGGGIKGQPKSEHFKQTMSEIQKDGKSWMCGKHHSEETKKKMSESRSGSKHPMYGKHHKDESKRKMREAKLNNLPIICTSEHNPMKGKIWYTDGINSKPINASEVSYYENLGWHKGRTILK